MWTLGDIMIQNQQIIPSGNESEEEMEPFPAQDHIQQQTNTYSQQHEQAREEDQSIFQAIQKYLEQHCCLKFLLFLLIILLIVGINQQKGYLVKKQHTLKFFIEKIQKEKIKKQLISENQDKIGQNIDTQPHPTPQATTQSSNTGKSDSTDEEKANYKQESKQISQNQNLNTTLQKSTQAQQMDKRYESIEGITMSKIVQAARWRNLKNQDILMHSELANQQLSYYQQKYKIDQYQELPFCIVVPTYNNVASNRHISNIRSIVMQNYTNYHIVVIDDASTDGTGKEIQQFFQMQSKIKSDHYEIIINKQNQGSLKNIRKAAFQNCQSNQIFMIVDGDDELIGRQVLKLYNAIYQETGAWLVYSNFFTEQGKLGYSKPIPDRITEANEYRKYPFVTSHLRSFYTQLLRNIKEEDLLGKDGNYFRAANDVSMMLPCLEMAHRRIIYVPQLTYMYNEGTGLNNHQLKLLQQKRNERYIRLKGAYQKLDQLVDGNVTLGINDRDDLLHDSEKKQWFRQAIEIKKKTKDLGNFIDHFSHKP